MSWSLHLSDVTPDKAREMVNDDDHVPDAVKALLDGMLETAEKAGIKNLRLMTYGHFNAGDNWTFGGQSTCTCEITNVEKVSEDAPPDAA